MNISKLKDISATYTGNMREAFRQAGFQVLTDSKYLNSDTYLLPGDILLNDVHHTATNISLGSYMMNTTASSSVADILNDTSLKYGSKGPEVKTMQEMLIACGYYCGPDGADGDFGKNTFEALKKFQKEAGLGAVDGWYGKQTKAALEAAYKKSKQKYASGGQKTYFVKVTAGALNIRTGPGTENPVVGTITDRGVYTIVETQGDWGKLKSGAGWICLKYTKKVNV